MKSIILLLGFLLPIFLWAIYGGLCYLIYFIYLSPIMISLKIILIIILIIIAIIYAILVDPYLLILTNISLVCGLTYLVYTSSIYILFKIILLTILIPLCIIGYFLAIFILDE